MIETLRVARISYCHLASLGGRRSKNAAVDSHLNAGWEHRAFHNYADYAETAPFRVGLAKLLAMAASESCVIMCAEAVWWRCHRRNVTDHVLAHGVPVVHLLTRTNRQPAAMTKFAIVGARRRVSYPGVPTARNR